MLTVNFDLFKERKKLIEMPLLKIIVPNYYQYCHWALGKFSPKYSHREVTCSHVYETGSTGTWLKQCVQQL
jgi:hypothetical protein